MKIMKMPDHFLERTQNISENEFLNFYFLNVDIFLTMTGLTLRLYRCIENIAVKGTVSQIFDIGPSLFFMKFRKKYSIE